MRLVGPAVTFIPENVPYVAIAEYVRVDTAQASCMASSPCYYHIEEIKAIS
jgi:hypothetical protein